MNEFILYQIFQQKISLFDFNFNLYYPKVFLKYRNRINRLNVLKLRAAKEMLKIEQKSLAPISTKDSVVMAVSLNGIGPTFKLRVSVTNTGDDVHVLDDYFIFFLYEKSLYK